MQELQENTTSNTNYKIKKNRITGTRHTGKETQRKLKRIEINTGKSTESKSLNTQENTTKKNSKRIQENNARTETPETRQIRYGQGKFKNQEYINI